MRLPHVLDCSIVALFFAPLVHAQKPDPWATFNTNIKACTVVGKAYGILPSKQQDSLITFCNSFVGYSTTTVTGQTVSWVTAPVPLKTVTVAANAPRRYQPRVEEKAHNLVPRPTSPTYKRVTPTVSASTITPPPLAPIHGGHELKRANSKLQTPALFKNQASLLIRTGCACLGFATQYTYPVFTTTTATSTVPASCALAPLSAYHLSSYSPASAVAAAYEYGWFYFYESVEGCCKDCIGRPGCVQFIYEAIDPAQGIGSGRCNFLYLDDYDGNTVTGVPRLAGENSMLCPNGYLAVNGLVPDTSSTTITSATYLGPCAVSTRRR